MANRREFLQIGIAASTWSMAAQAKGITGISGNTKRHVSFYKTVFDSRYQDSVNFASQIRKQQGDVHSINGDITSFWFNELDALWRKKPVAVAGMTAHGPLFCLERLAWERGMRVVFRATHQLQGNGIIEHQLTGPENMLKKSQSGELSLASLGSNWSKGMAKLILECPEGHTALDKLNVTAPVTEGFSQSEQVDIYADPLISWIIAPAQQG